MNVWLVIWAHQRARLQRHKYLRGILETKVEVGICQNGEGVAVSVGVGACGAGDEPISVGRHTSTY